MVTLVCLWMVTLVFLWMVTLVFLWMVTLVFLTPAVGYPNLNQIRMVNLDQVHWGRLKLCTQKWGRGSNNLY